MRVTKLDGLRGIFSLAVIFYHYSSYYLPDFISNLFFIRESYTFVDFFFVLSGFVIAYNYNTLGTKKDLWLYLKKRFIRIYPLLFFTTIIFLIFEITANILFPKLVDTHESIQMSFFKTIDTLFLTNSTPIFRNTGMGMNYPSWSISSEMISYVIFGVISIYFIKVKKFLAIVFVVFLTFLFLIWKKYFFFLGDYGFIRGLVSFNFGYFVWYFSQKKIRLNNNLEYLIPIILLILLQQLNSYDGEFKQMFGLFTIPLFFGLSIFTLLKTNGFLSEFLDKKPLQFLGKVSYSLYLNHSLLIIIIPRGFFKLLKIPQNTVTEILVFIVSIIIIIFYSNFTYKYIEIKGGKILRKILFKN